MDGKKGKGGCAFFIFFRGQKKIETLCRECEDCVDTMTMVHPTAIIIKESALYEFARTWSLVEEDEWDEGFGWWKYLEDTPYTKGEQELAGWNSADDAKRGRENIANGAQDVWYFGFEIVR